MPALRRQQLLICCCCFFCFFSLPLCVVYAEMVVSFHAGEKKVSKTLAGM